MRRRSKPSTKANSMDYLAACVTGMKLSKQGLNKLSAHLNSFLDLFLDQPYLYADDVSMLNLPVIPSLPSSPVLIMDMNPIKNRLPLVTFGDFQDRRRRVSSSAEEEICAICLSRLERGDEMRELPNCCHAFHGECLDGWIDQHQITCPTCRSTLILSGQGQQHHSSTAQSISIC